MNKRERWFEIITCVVRSMIAAACRMLRWVARYGRHVISRWAAAATELARQSIAVAPSIASRLRPGATWLGHRLVPVFAIALLVLSMGGTWHLAGAAPKTIAEELVASESAPARPVKKSARELTGKLNLNTATEEQLVLLPAVGPAKAERIVAWRKKNGGFRRIADLRRVKGFGYKTFKRLEPFLDIRGETTLK